MATPPSQQPVKQRRVFYLSGFDPRGGRHYHSLYQKEALLRPAEATSQIDVGRRKLVDGNLCWEVTSTNKEHTGNAQPNPDHTARTDFNFLSWDDIVRQHWPKNGLKHWLAYLKQTPTYLLSGFFRKPWVLGPPIKDPLIPAAGLLFFPNVLIVGTLLAMALSIWLMFSLLTQAQQPAWLAALASLPLAWGLWRCAHWFENSRDIGWTMRSYAFTAKQSKGQVPELEARLTAFAQQVIARAKQNKDDEILIVGHSSGAVMAVAVMARALALCPELPGFKAKLGLLTMGQCLPMLGLLPGADTFRAELHTLARAKGLFWVDVSAPSDRCCVAMIDPYVSCGVEPAPDGEGSQFLAVNPLFHEVFAQPSYHALKKNAFQLHFQYIKAPPAIGAYDYFEVSAGALSLEERFSQQILLPLPKDFEAHTYLRLNPDLRLSESDAVYHYRQHGAREHRAYRLQLPSDFDAVKYLELNPDVAAAGIDAEIHYMQHGLVENRRYR
jgi:pimeloyl-ACP methyl ester carboxylesterase